MSHTLYLGIDVAKDSFDIASEPPELTRSFVNDAAGRRCLLEALEGKQVALIVMEATGGYERDLVACLLAAGQKVVVANPRQVRDFARGLGQLAKTDRLDARVLAKFAALVKPQPRRQASGQVSDLAELVSRRRQMSDLRTQELNRLPHARHPRVKKSLKKTIDLLERQIEELDELIRRNIESDDDLRRKDQIIRSVKGVGPATSAMLLSQLPELGQLNRQQIAALAGLAPWDFQSGKWAGQSKIWGGRMPVRNMLYMAAMAAIRSNIAIREFYHRLRSNGKIFKVAITACMRKLLITINSLIRNDCQWSPAKKA